jgi:tetratricopeptide (TPR) repeat protein
MRTSSVDVEAEHPWGLESGAYRRAARTQRCPAASKTMKKSGQLVAMAHTLREQGEFEGALNASTDAIYENPADHGAWFARALVLADLGEFRQALLSCERVLDLDPEHQPSRNMRLALNAQLVPPLQQGASKLTARAGPPDQGHPRGADHPEGGRAAQDQRNIGRSHPV